MVEIDPMILALISDTNVSLLSLFIISVTCMYYIIIVHFTQGYCSHVLIDNKLKDFFYELASCIVHVVRYLCNLIYFDALSQFIYFDALSQGMS